MKPSTPKTTTTAGRVPRRKTPAKTGKICSRNKNDVLLGRGKGCTCSNGNQRYLTLIEKYAPAYVQAKSRKEQNDVKLNIIREVREYEGHFLQPVEGSNESQWEEAPLETVLNKIAQSLRYHIRKGKISPVDNEPVAPPQDNQQRQLGFQKEFSIARAAVTMPTIKPTDLWSPSFHVSQPQLSLSHQHQRPYVVQASSLLDERRDFRLPTIVTPAQQHLALGAAAVAEEFGMFNNEFLRKVAFFGRLHQDDPSNAMEV